MVVIVGGQHQLEQVLLTAHLHQEVEAEVPLIKYLQQEVVVPE